MSGLQALLWGGFTSASLYIGEALAHPLAANKRVVALVMGFGAGTLLSAIAYELIPESSPTGSSTARAAAICRAVDAVDEAERPQDALRALPDRLGGRRWEDTAEGSPRPGNTSFETRGVHRCVCCRPRRGFVSGPIIAHGHDIVVPRGQRTAVSHRQRRSDCSTRVIHPPYHRLVEQGLRKTEHRHRNADAAEQLSPRVHSATLHQAVRARGPCPCHRTFPCSSAARPPRRVGRSSSSHARGRPTRVGAWSARTCLGVAPPGARHASAVGLVAEGSPTDRGRVGCRAAQVQRASSPRGGSRRGCELRVRAQALSSQRSHTKAD